MLNWFHWLPGLGEATAISVCMLSFGNNYYCTDTIAHSARMLGTNNTLEGERKQQWSQKCCTDFYSRNCQAELPFQGSPLWSETSDPEVGLQAGTEQRAQRCPPLNFHFPIIYGERKTAQSVVLPHGLLGVAEPHLSGRALELRHMLLFHAHPRAKCRRISSSHLQDKAYTIMLQMEFQK